MAPTPTGASPIISRVRNRFLALFWIYWNIYRPYSFHHSNSSGTEMTVFGTINTRNDSGLIDPSWSCIIDNQSIGVMNPFQFVENNWVLCSTKNLTNSPHTLTVNVNSKGQSFFFDYLQYDPSNQDDALAGALVQVPRDDPAIKYDADRWEPLGDIATLTRVRGSSMTFDFIGRSVAWYGPIPAEFPIQPSLASYTIDGGPPQSFALKGLGPTEVTAYNQKMFEVDNLPFGTHTLKVTFESDNTTTPLTLGSLLVQNGTVTTSPASTTTNTPPIAVEATSKSRVNVAGIVCGVLAVLLLGLLLAFVFFRYRRRRKVGELQTFPNPFTSPLKRLTRPKAPRMRQMSTLDLLEQPPDPTPSRTPALPPNTSIPPATRALPVEGYSGHPGPSRNFENVENWIQQQAGGSRPRIDKQQARRTEPPPRSPPPPMSEALDENASYYGGYQTWGQAKELEAKLSGKQRASYM